VSQFLRQSTAATLPIGPAVDKSDGVTPETGLAAGTVDEIVVYKHDATAATDISGTTTFTHRAGGMYTATLSASDTNTRGRLMLYVRDTDVCLPMWATFMVIAANVYDALVGGTDKLQVDAVEISSSTTTADNVEAKIGNLDAQVSSRSSHSAAAVWAVGTRTLTSFGSLVADIWAYGTRTLTSFGTLVAQIVGAVLDEARADHDEAGSVGETINHVQAGTANMRVLGRSDGSVEYHNDGATPQNRDPRLKLTPVDTTDPTEVVMVPSTS